MTKTNPKAPSLSAVAAVLALLGFGAATAMWWTSMQQYNRQIEQKRSALKRLHLTGRIPPNKEVTEYLTERGAALEQQYAASIKFIADTPQATEAQANPQLYFQERLHDVQRTLERLATARSMEVPDQLGFPKDLPPADVVPRLLLQLQLIEGASELIMAQGVTQLVSVKVEDPQTVAPPAGSDQAPFLTRLPVRIRLTGSLESLIKVLNVLNTGAPLMDVHSVRMAALPDSADLDAEILIARYMVTKPELDEPPAAKPEKSTGARKKKPS